MLINSFTFTCNLSNTDYSFTFHWFASFPIYPDNLKCPSFSLRPPYPNHKPRTCNAKSLISKENWGLLHDHPQLSAFLLYVLTYLYSHPHCFSPYTPRGRGLSPLLEGISSLGLRISCFPVNS